MRVWTALAAATVVATGCYNFDSFSRCWDASCHPGDMVVPEDAGGVLDASRVDLTPDASVESPPSCARLSRTCGASRDRSCCESLLVPAGAFLRSDDSDFPAAVGDFRLDRYEVTVGRFRKLIEAGGPGTQVAPPPGGSGAGVMPGTGWDPAWNGQLSMNPATIRAALRCDAKYETWTDAPGANESRPINCVDWYEAFAFCIWDGGRLPTEAEWNYAAAGGNDQRPYPWSTTPSDVTIDPSYAVYNGAPLAVVGSKSPKGDGRWGHSDLAGNVWGWVLDWYGAYPKPCVDCANVAPAQVRVLRGGSFGSSASVLLTMMRPNAPPSHRDNSSGFRCARNAR